MQSYFDLAIYLNIATDKLFTPRITKRQLSIVCDHNMSIYKHDLFVFLREAS